MRVGCPAVTAARRPAPFFVYPVLEHARCQEFCVTGEHRDKTTEMTRIQQGHPVPRKLGRAKAAADPGWLSQHQGPPTGTRPRGGGMTVGSPSLAPHRRMSA